MKKMGMALMIGVSCLCLNTMILSADTIIENASGTNDVENSIWGEWISTFQCDSDDIHFNMQPGMNVTIDENAVYIGNNKCSYSYAEDVLSINYLFFSTDYDVVLKDNTMELYIGDILQNSLIRSEDYDINSLEQYVEIENVDGELERFGITDLQAICKENELKIEKKYIGCPLTVVSTVEEINGATTYNGFYMDSYIVLSGKWVVDTSGYEDVVCELSKGDLVTVKGNLFSMGFDKGYIYKINGHDVTVQID